MPDPVKKKGDLLKVWTDKCHDKSDFYGWSQYYKWTGKENVKAERPDQKQLQCEEVWLLSKKELGKKRKDLKVKVWPIEKGERGLNQERLEETGMSMEGWLLRVE